MMLASSCILTPCCASLQALLLLLLVVLCMLCYADASRPGPCRALQGIVPLYLPPAFDLLLLQPVWHLSASV